jgi:predicted dehydrogenase/threonine dehydrogenase-like Zn-dependent dehydrogenase
MTMLQVAQSYKTGKVTIERVAPPALLASGIIVRTSYSVISAGTEGMKVREGRMNYLQMARSRPDQVKQVLDTVRQHGILATVEKVRNRLDTQTPLGYCLAGTVEAVGAEATEFEIGQAVACAGAGYANHAEFNYVPRNLAVPIPAGVALEHAAFATIGAIALHAFRQAAVQLGETALVVGLGLVGQVLVRVLHAAGVHAYGVDVDQTRCALALNGGAAGADVLQQAAWRRQLMRATGGLGPDCVFLTVGSETNAPLELASEIVRDRGRLVCVGKTGLNLDYNTFFRKEVDLRFSRSYGPGRYDPSYEEKGRDYPIGYVRWTERRNLAAFLDLLARGAIDLAPLISEIHPFSQAPAVYNSLAEGKFTGVGVLFEFDKEAQYAPERSQAPTMPPTKACVAGQVRLGVIGAGNYAASMLLPHLARDSRACLGVVATASALSAANAKRKFGFARAGTDYQAVLGNREVDAVVIATRHKSHAAMAAEALRAGKAVFVEKPLAIDGQGLDLVVKARNESGNARLMVGFNRRYAPIMQDLKAALGCPPTTMIYRVHAGQLPPSSWLNDSEEGSRFVGEAGHFLDVLSYVAGAPAVSVAGSVLRPAHASRDDLENVSVVVRYANGSVGTLIYVTQGGAQTPKERLEVFGGSMTVVMDNFRQLSVFSGSGRERRRSGYGGNKGQKQEMASFIAACRGEAAWPFDEMVELTRLTIAAERAARSGERVDLQSQHSMAMHACCGNIGQVDVEMGNGGVEQPERNDHHQQVSE